MRTLLRALPAILIGFIASVVVAALLDIAFAMGGLALDPALVGLVSLATWVLVGWWVFRASSRRGLAPDGLVESEDMEREGAHGIEEGATEHKGPESPRMDEMAVTPAEPAARRGDQPWWRRRPAALLTAAGVAVGAVAGGAWWTGLFLSMDTLAWCTSGDGSFPVYLSVAPGQLPVPPVFRIEDYDTQDLSGSTLYIDVGDTVTLAGREGLAMLNLHQLAWNRAYLDWVEQKPLSFRRGCRRAAADHLDAPAEPSRLTPLETVEEFPTVGDLLRAAFGSSRDTYRLRASTAREESYLTLLHNTRIAEFEATPIRDDFWLAMGYFFCVTADHSNMTTAILVVGTSFADATEMEKTDRAVVIGAASTDALCPEYRQPLAEFIESIGDLLLPLPRV